MSVIALIPARSGSKGIPGKNLRQLGDGPLYAHAIHCAIQAGVQHVVVSADWVMSRELYTKPDGAWTMDYLRRPSELAQDDTPMIAVVRHALSQIPGTPEDIIVLLQPTQPFRTPAHVREAIWLLQETQADSVVSVVPLPLTHSPDAVCEVIGGHLRRWNQGFEGTLRVAEWPTRRQDARPAYMRDGTCYAFWRKTVELHGTIYGQDVRPLLIDHADSVELDTELDWAACVRRGEERHGSTGLGSSEV